MALLFIACDRGVGPDQGQGEQSALRQETATNEPDLTLKAATCSEVIDGVLKSLNDSYFSPRLPSGCRNPFGNGSKERNTTA